MFQLRDGLSGYLYNDLQGKIVNNAVHGVIRSQPVGKKNDNNGRTQINEGERSAGRSGGSLWL